MKVICLVGERACSLRFTPGCLPQAIQAELLSPSDARSAIVQCMELQSLVLAHMLTQVLKF